MQEYGHSVVVTTYNSIAKLVEPLCGPYYIYTNLVEEFFIHYKSLSATTPNIVFCALFNFNYIYNMIEIGRYNTLQILRETTVGLFLGDDDGEDVLLPNKYMPEEYEIDDMIEVFVYLDYDERKIATNLTPFIHLNEFALLEVAIVDKVGAFMDWD